MKKLYLLLSLLTCYVLTVFAGNTVNIQGKEYPVDTITHMKVGPGTYYTALHLMDSKSPLRTHILEVDATNPYIQIKSVLGVDSTVTCERPSNMAKRKSKDGLVYFAGTNADFFVTVGQVGLPINGCVIDGQIGRTPISSRPLIGFDKQNVSFLDFMTFSGSVSFNGENCTINNVNETRGENQLILYNTSNGNYTHTNDYGKEVLIELLPENEWTVNKTLRFKVVNVVSKKGNMKMGAKQAVLSGHGTAETYLDKLSVGDEAELTLQYAVKELTTQPNLDAVVGGDRYILMDNNVTDNDWAELHPRTAMGYSADKKKIYFCIVDGRWVNSAGVTTKQLADVIKSAGAAYAINLDGGGSSCMYIKEYDQVNHGSDGSERAVSNGIFAVSTAPADENITEIKAMRQNVKVPFYGVLVPTVLGYNQYGVLVNKDVQGFKLSCTPGMGVINEQGAFVASGTQGGPLTIEYNGIKSVVNIELVSEAEIAIRLDSVIIDSRSAYEIEVQSIIGENIMPVLPSALTWEVADPALCKVENGLLIALSNGETMLTGHLGSFSDQLKVRIEIPEKDILPADDFADPVSWEAKVSTNLKEFVMTPVAPSSLTMGYTFTSGRASTVRLSKPGLDLYGLPDHIKFVFDPHDIALSKVVVAIKAANASSATQIEYSSVKNNEDNVITITKEDITATAADKISYPLSLDYITFFLAATGNTVNQGYTLDVKEFSLKYDNLIVGIDDPKIISRLRIYPNPSVNGMAYAMLNLTEATPVSVTIYNQSGQLVRTNDMGVCLSDLIELPVKGLSPGMYLVNITYGKQTDTVKLTIR